MKNLIAQLNALPQDVGIIDSGIGGISALNALNKSGVKSVTYIADTAYLPYGEKSYEVLLERTQKMTEFLLHRNISTIIVACHTVSATVLPTLKHMYPRVTFIDLLFPIVSHAVSQTRTKTIGVLATYNTVESHRFPTLIHSFDSNYQVFQQACPQFVLLLESPELDIVMLDYIIDTYLESFMHTTIDTIILGCTHYAFLSDSIMKRLQTPCTLVSAYSCIQYALRKNNSAPFSLDFFISGSVELFKISSQRVLQISSLMPIVYREFI